MLIVAVGLLASGKISTRSPLASAYSVIPSTVAPFVSPAGSCATRCASGASGASGATASGSRSAAANRRRRYGVTGVIRPSVVLGGARPVGGGGAGRETPKLSRQLPRQIGR